MIYVHVHSFVRNICYTFTSIVLKSESETPLPAASTMTGAAPVRTAVIRKAVLTDPRAGTVTRTRRNNSISEIINYIHISTSL